MRNSICKIFLRKKNSFYCAGKSTLGSEKVSYIHIVLRQPTLSLTLRLIKKNVYTFSSQWSTTSKCLLCPCQWTWPEVPQVEVGLGEGIPGYRSWVQQRWTKTRRLICPICNCSWGMSHHDKSSYLQLRTLFFQSQL